MSAPCTIRLAMPADTGNIASLMLEAGGGLFEQMLEGIVPELSVAALLALAINDESSPWHFENAFLAEVQGSVCGMALAYPAAEYGFSALAQTVVPPERLAPLAPLLASAPPPSLYINSLAVRPGFARCGVATQLLQAFTKLAEAEGHDRLSLHVWSDNQPAMKLYAKLGFQPLETIAVTPTPYLRFTGPVTLMIAETQNMRAND